MSVRHAATLAAVDIITRLPERIRRRYGACRPHTVVALFAVSRGRPRRQVAITPAATRPLTPDSSLPRLSFVACLMPVYSATVPRLVR